MKNVNWKELFIDILVDIVAGMIIAVGIYNFALNADFPVAGFSEAYKKFSQIMKPYIRPRVQGVKKPEWYIEGLAKYISDVNEKYGTDYQIDMEKFDGTGTAEEAEKIICEQIDKGLPVPYLMLRHLNVEKYKDFIWHWFLVVGYEKNEQGMWIDVATYGEKVRLDLMELWKTGCEEKGGIVIYELKNTEVQSKNE